ncbi:MAG: type II toxin-antitoxin system RelE/ParE family toxin [Bacteroidales bacterium]|nr:type II toxin-antitoxin system RelE/ParE family toxin [Bacteroidales bacterium]
MVRKKKLKVIWSYDAKEHLHKIYKFIRKDSPQNAIRVKEIIILRVKQLPENPYISEEDKYKIDNPGNYRAFTIFSYRIAYKITDESILILRIRHTSREPLNYV